MKYLHLCPSAGLLACSPLAERLPGLWLRAAWSSSLGTASPARPRLPARLKHQGSAQRQGPPVRDIVRALSPGTSLLYAAVHVRGLEKHFI